MKNCSKCGFQGPWLGDHMVEAHGAPFNISASADPLLWAEFQETFRGVKREPPPEPGKLTVSFGRYSFPVNTEVPAQVCLPLPAHYQLPTHGSLGADIEHALIALACKRSLYVWGLPGSGKDALFHAFSALTRCPAILKQVKPGTDIESWFFTRAFNEKGTYWEEGDVLRALRDGYLAENGVRYPYMLLVSDFDRADISQAEHLRLVTDSIQGRVDGPGGKTHVVYPGTRIVATANTMGAGDERSRMVSATPLDASLLDRFERKIQFHWMDWEDEGPIVTKKFPLVFQRYPAAYRMFQDVTQKIRGAILRDELYGEFSHRALCAILGHAEDILTFAPHRVNNKLFGYAARIWLDGLPDEETKRAAKSILDAQLGTIPDVNTIKQTDLMKEV